MRKPIDPQKLNQQVETAVTILHEYLSDGLTRRRDPIERVLRGFGVSTRAAKIARERLGVRRWKELWDEPLGQNRGIVSWLQITGLKTEEPTHS